MDVHASNWTEAVFELCLKLFTEIKNKTGISLSKRLYNESGNIDQEVFQQSLLALYNKHSCLYKTEFGYLAGNELDSHKRGACLFCAIMDISPYDENSFFLNEMVAANVAYNHVHEDMILSCESRGLSESTLQYLKQPAFFRGDHLAFDCIYEENRDYFTCLIYALHRECQMRDSANYPNYSMLSLLLFHYERNILFWRQIYTGRYELPNR